MKVEYYLIDLNLENAKKIFIEEPTYENIINMVSEHFKKPLFRLFVRHNEKSLINESISKFKLYDYNESTKFKMGDFYLQIEGIGAL